MDAQAEKLKCNGDKILTDILSCFGVETAVFPSIEEAGFLDIPNIFKWLFFKKDGMSDAGTALLEADIYYHHTITFYQISSLTLQQPIIWWVISMT